MATIVPAPILDTRDGDQVVAEAIAALPDELSDRSDSNPAVVIIEANGGMFDKILYIINQWPSAVIQKCLNLVGIILEAASPGIVTQTFILSSPQRQDSVIPAGTLVSTNDGTITYATVSDLTIAKYVMPAGTIAMTAGGFTVTGTSTAFPTDGSWSGYQIQVPNGAWYTIASVSSATSLTLSTETPAISTVAGATFNVGPVSGTVSAQATSTGLASAVAAAGLTVLQSSPAGVSTTSNGAASSGSADTETIPNAIIRAASAFAARDIACTAEDYAYFAQKILGQNSRAFGKMNMNDSTSEAGCVTVAMLSPSWTPSVPVTTLERGAVARDLFGRQFGGSTTIDVAADITSYTSDGATPVICFLRKSIYDVSAAQLAVAAALNNYLSPTTYPWGRTIDVADLVGVVEKVAAVDHVFTINGVSAVGMTYTQSAATMTFSNVSTGVSSVGATDYAAIIAGQSFIMDQTYGGAYLVTAKAGGNALTLDREWAGPNGAQTIHFFQSQNTALSKWYTLPYANLSVNAASPPSSILIVGVV